MAKEFNESQKKAINVMQNAVVSAGAGSGKTSVLSARFAHLVKDLHYGVDEILTLTFTKKASVEMYDRIYSAIKDDPKAASEFDKANIKTLDSYCAQVARLGSHFYGISPDFSVGDADVKEHVESMALKFIIERKDDETVRKLVSDNDFMFACKEILVKPIMELSTVSSPIDFDAMLKNQKNFMKEKWEKETERLEKAIEVLENNIKDFEGNANIEFIANLKTGIKSLNEAEFSTFSKTKDLFDPMNFQSLETILNALLAFSKVRHSSAKHTEEIKETHKEIREIIENLLLVGNFAFSIPEAQKTFSLIHEFQDEVNDYKRSTGLLTYADVSSLAFCILRDYPEIRAIEKRRYKEIMIDEFQDNNGMQRDLLFMLAERLDRMEKGVPPVQELEKEKLFFVGDEKQSIYKFRGADVSVFHSLSNNFTGEGQLNLSVNYRSRPAIIAMFNTMFGGEAYPTAQDSGAIPAVFYKESVDPKYIPEYEAQYHHVLHDPKWNEELENKRESYEKRTTIALCQTEHSEDADEPEAHWVAQKIKALIDKKLYAPEQIAVLFRTTSPQPLIERTFLSYGIPYSTEVVKGIFSDGVINDMNAWLRLCAYPKDTQAYAQALRSPLVNLSIHETNAILCSGHEVFTKDDSAFLSGSSKERYLSGCDFYRTLCDSSRTESLTETIDRIWYGAGYRYETMMNSSVSMYAQYYDILFELARRAEDKGMSVADFSDSLLPFLDETKKMDDMDIPRESMDGVHLMTIHKSKGLEFPVVFVVGCGKGKPPAGKKPPIVVSKKYGISLNGVYTGAVSEKNSNLFKILSQEEDKALEFAELKRVFYVAATRAKDYLYISGRIPTKPDNSKFGEHITDIFMPQVEYFKENSADSPYIFEEIPCQDFDFSIKDERNFGKADFIKKAHELYENSITIEYETPKNPHVQPSKLHAAAQKPSAPENVPFKEISELVENSHGFGYTDFGKIAHAYLEAEMNGTKPQISNTWIVGLEGSKEKLELVKQAAQKMSEAFIQSDLGKEAKTSAWKRAEYDFRAKIGERILNGQIDLLYKNKDGSYTVVDYKTDSTIFPQEHTNQLASYQFAVSELFGIARKNVKCFLHYLKFGENIEITDECLNVNLEQVMQGISE